MGSQTPFPENKLYNIKVSEKAHNNPTGQAYDIHLPSSGITLLT
jgi:hypothetical protein